MELAVINNTGVTCDNIRLLGRVPFKGNTDVVTGKDLGTTVDSKMLGGVQADVVNENKNDAIVY